MTSKYQVDSGNVKGIDIEEGQINLAKDYASEQGISNVSFKVANVYELPFEDNSFDAAFAHTLGWNLVKSKPQSGHESTD